MNTSRCTNRILATIILVAAACGISFGQKITQYTGAPSPLPSRWKWAAEEAGRQEIQQGFWIGYSIERMMGEHSFTGSFHSDKSRNHPTLHELLTGMRSEPAPDATGGFPGSMVGNATSHDGEQEEKLVKKEVGIIFHISVAAKQSIDDVKVSNLSLKVDFRGDPVVWLGGADADESVEFLIDRYGEATTRDARESILMAIGFHRDSERAYEFLKNFLQGSGDEGLRGKAAFWLGQTESDQARKILAETAMKDASDEVREQAVFALSRMESEMALDALISVARTHPDGDTRERAAFWLAQKASTKTLGTLREIAYGDEDTEVQRSAMFALTRMDGGEGVDELIKIAKSHHNPGIRKDAIFWLGQSEDPKALDVLVDIVKGR